MKRIILVLSIVLLIVSAASISFAEDKKGGYIAIKPGAYFPTGDLDDRNFDSSFAGELTVGMYYNRNLALETNIGYFQTGASRSIAGFREEDDIRVVPITATFKGVLPFNGFELTAGVGGGIYIAHLDIDGHNVSKDENDTVWGAHFVAGANVDLSKKVFLGVEGKYIVTSEADFSGAKVDLNGVIVTGVVGYRF